MVAIALGIMAIATGAAAGEASREITNPALALATQVEEVVVQQPAAYRAPLSQDRHSLLSNISIEFADAPQRDVTFGTRSALDESPPVMEMQLATKTPFNFDVGVARRQVSGQSHSQFTEGSGAELRLGQKSGSLGPGIQKPGFRQDRLVYVRRLRRGGR